MEIIMTLRLILFHLSFTRYLNNFCSWQRNQKGKLQEDWDHALMLSGLDLWDGDPELTSVIGCNSSNNSTSYICCRDEKKGITFSTVVTGSYYYVGTL